MPDDLKKRGSPDSKRININEPHEVKYWTEKLNVTPAELKKVVKDVGDSAAAVKKKLGK